MPLANEIEMVLSWENNVGFILTAKKNSGPVKTIVSMDENGKIGELWSAAQQLCITYISAELKSIGLEMKAP